MKVCGRGAALTLGLCALAALALSPAASAKSGYYAFPGYRESALSLKGTHGFQVSVSANDRIAELSVTRKDSVAVYYVKADGPPGERIEATFPGLGRVAVGFHPSQAVQRKPPFFPHCHGGAGTVQKGVFRGTIKFRGEGGFTAVNALHARGYIESTSREVCPRDDHDSSTDIDVGGHPTPGYSLAATKRSGGRILSFSAFRQTSESVIDDETWFTAVLAEKVRAMRILRVASATVQSGGLPVTGDQRGPNSTSVSPPAPFRGTANFEGTGNESTWEGTLAVDLPGAPDLELTGPSFRSSLCLNKKCVGAPRRQP